MYNPGTAPYGTLYITVHLLYTLWHTCRTPSVHLPYTLWYTRRTPSVHCATRRTPWYSRLLYVNPWVNRSRRRCTLRALLTKWLLPVVHQGSAPWTVQKWYTDEQTPPYTDLDSWYRQTEQRGPVPGRLDRTDRAAIPPYTVVVHRRCTPPCVTAVRGTPLQIGIGPTAHDAVRHRPTMTNDGVHLPWVNDGE